MEATKYTPGPWAATPSDPAEGVECIWITACPAPNQEKEIAAVYGPQNERNKATAALIAAAPDLVEALQCARNFIDGMPLNNDRSDALSVIDAALSKAGV